MTTQEIADRLYELCKNGQFETAQSELFSEHATSTEKDMTGNFQTITGLEAIHEKGVNFRSMIEENHGGFCNEPKVFGNEIFMEMGMDSTMKGQGRITMGEMCQYEVSDGKIISEQFYY
jgi:hypothetical protein